MASSTGKRNRVTSKKYKKTNKSAKVSSMSSKAKVTKKNTRKKASAGSGGIKTPNRFNLRLALPLILILAVVGGLFVWRSFAASSSTSLVTEWYQTCHQRQPDAGGLAYWSGRLDRGENQNTVFAAYVAAGGCTPKATATKPAPATSSKAPQTYGSLSDDDYITKIYYELLGLQPDMISRKDWLTRLSNKSWTRTQVYNHIASSPGSKAYVSGAALKDSLGAGRSVDKYKEATAAFEKYFVDQFFAAYNARGGQLKDSLLFKNLSNSCQKSVTEVKAGIAPGWTLYSCMSLVGLPATVASDAGSYARLVSSGQISISQAISEMETPPATVTNGCSVDKKDYVDCLAWNKRSILVVDNPSNSSGKTKKITSSDRNLSTQPTSTPGSTATSSGSNSSNKTVAEGVREDVLNAIMQTDPNNSLSSRSSLGSLQQEVFIQTANREKQSIDALIIPSCSGNKEINNKSSADCVKRAQQLLAVSQNPSIVISGNYDANTEKEVKKFQAARSLPATGVVDNKTRAILETIIDTSQYKSPLSPSRGLLSNLR